MDIVLIIIGILLLLLLGMWLFTYIDIEILYEKTDLDKRADIVIKYLFFKKRIGKADKKDKKKKESAPKEKKGIEYYKEKINLLEKLFEEIKDDIIDILKFSRERLIRIKKLDFDFIFGLDDPMDTGIVNGLSYALCYNILGVIHQNSYIEKSNINITPDFDNVCARLRFNCILRMKNVHITVIIVKAIKVYYKLKKAAKATKERK